MKKTTSVEHTIRTGCQGNMGVVFMFAVACSTYGCFADHGLGRAGLDGGVVDGSQTGDSRLDESALCGRDQHVGNGLCVPCPGGTLNEAGDDPAGESTLCDDRSCAQQDHTCGLSMDTYIKASNPESRDRFGDVVSLSGDLLAVGACEESGNGRGVNPTTGEERVHSSGAVYVFRRQGTHWVQEAYIKASNAEEEDHFGCSVSLLGDTLAVGAPEEDSRASGVNLGEDDNSSVRAGAAYVFRREDGEWQQEAYLKVGPGAALGTAVALYEGGLVVGAPRRSGTGNGEHAHQGAAFVFTRGPEGWSRVGELRVEDTAGFGRTMAVHGNTLVITGSVYEGSNAYVFRFDDGEWALQTELRPLFRQARFGLNGSGFGAAIAVHNNTVVIGATRESGSGRGVTTETGETQESTVWSGAAFVFTEREGEWVYDAYLKANNTDDRDNFGGAVAVWGDMVVVGAVYEEGGTRGLDGDAEDRSAFWSGASYMYTRRGGEWSFEHYIKAPNSEEYDRFGGGLAMDGRTLVIGAARENGGVAGINGDMNNNDRNGSGAVYVYQIE